MRSLLPQEAAVHDVGDAVRVHVLHELQEVAQAVAERHDLVVLTHVFDEGWITSQWSSSSSFTCLHCVHAS